MATPDGGTHVSTSSLFSSLLEQSRKLRQETDSADLPSIQLGLGELERRAKELKKTPTGHKADARARYLLAAGGINTDENLRDLESIDFQTAWEPSGPVDTDIGAYLRSRKDQNVASSIEESIRRTARDFDAFVAKNVTMDWDAQKQRIFEHFGLAPGASSQGVNEGPSSGSPSAFGKSSFGKSKLGASVGGGSGLRSSNVWANPGAGSSVLGKSVSRPSEGAAFKPMLFSDVGPNHQVELSRQVQMRQRGYAQVVKDMNLNRLSTDPGVGTFQVMGAFGACTLVTGNDQLTQQLADSWKLLASIVEEPEDHANNAFSGPKERELLKDYILNTAADSPEASRMRKRVERGSRRFLEKQFIQFVDHAIAENPQIAKVGGVPSVRNKFRGYINVKLAQNKDLPDWSIRNFDFIGDVPCWALVFYLLRAGLLKEADEFVRQHQQEFQKLDRGFAAYMHAYCTHEDRRLPRQLHDRIHGEYNNRVRHMEDSKDPFKPAVYKILGRCELTKRSMPNVMPTAEDWMWLQLVLSREIDRTSEPANEVFTLHDLQKAIQQFGARHFSSKGSNVGLYFQMLLMCGLFEDAVHYLYSFHFVDGVHFAIALTFYGLLRPSENPMKADQELLTLGAKGEKQINFPRLVGYYTRDFRTPDVEAAVDYLSLICLNGDLPGAAGQNQLKICHEALRELVLDTREFTKLLGDVRADGTREKGAIEKRIKLIKLSDQSDFLRTITEHAALQADDDGRAADAVLLYHLAEDYDTVVQILNKNLSNHIALQDNLTDYQNPTVPPPGHSSAASLAAMDDPVQLARSMLTMYRNNANIMRTIRPIHHESYGALQRICEARGYFKEDQWEQALGIIAQLDIIPLDPRVDVGHIRRKAQNFGALDDTVARNVGVLLKMVVECCNRLVADLSKSQYADSNKVQKMEELKARKKAAMIYAGLIQYKLPAHIYAFLNSREAD